MNKAFKSALRRAGLYDKNRPFRAHDMRHSFRTWLAQAKAGDAAESLLGHKLSGNDVTRRYVHYTLDDLRAEINKLPSLLPAEVVQEERKAN
jgi:integrase